MSRFIGSFLLLGVFIGWLVFSYASWVLPALSFGAADRWFALLLAGGFAVFLGIQCWLVVASARIFRPNGELGRAEVSAEFHLRRWPEIVWTAIPLAMTIVLAVWSLPTWLTLLGR